MTEQMPASNNDQGDSKPKSGMDELFPELANLSLEERKALVQPLIDDAEKELRESGVITKDPSASEVPAQPSATEATPQNPVPPTSEQK